jgi:glycerol-3-phosphate dehydrogenase (NAD(P)+)
MKVTVIGSGGWGTALAMLLLENGNDVTMWSYLQSEYEVLASQRENPLLKGVHIPEELKLTTDLNAAANVDMVVLATPSFAVRSTAKQLAGVVTPGTVLVSVSKGLEKGTSLRLSQVIEEEIGAQCPVVILSGPSHAEEVGRHIPTAVVTASASQAAAELAQDAFMNERFRVYSSPDVVGVEICAALKNVIALCAGCAHGMGFGDNTAAMLMTRGLTEIARLGEALGGHKETFAGLAGMGDLIVTCTSMHSRNNRCGILIGQGVPVDEAVKQIGAVVEGYYAAATAMEMAEKMGVEMPITHGAYRVLYEGADPHTIVTELMSRERKAEIEQSWV